MNKHASESSLQGERNEENESSIVVMQAGSYTLTEADRERLRWLASRPDSEIDFSDIPRSTPEELQEALRLNKERRAAKLKKAS